MAAGAGKPAAVRGLSRRVVSAETRRSGASQPAAECVMVGPMEDREVLKARAFMDGMMAMYAAIEREHGRAEAERLIMVAGKVWREASARTPRH